MNRLALLTLLAAGCSRPISNPPPEPPKYTPQPLTGALVVGDKLPPLQVAGWLNGPPPAPGSGGVKLLLVDVWAQWCPFCRQGVPGLLRLHKQYADRGVAFVSVSNMAKWEVESFLEHFPIPWASGYNMPTEMLPLFGASSGMQMEGYAVAPVVYLVGADGKIVWNDNQSRYRHKDAKAWEQELDAAIEAALGKNP
ncbi:MAG TPA: TlpA disulfide reductase family protein [Gemmataceae bacterium]|nr:TlpA disulfide reductase family protein [Gemmataceae bacterium]